MYPVYPRTRELKLQTNGLNNDCFRTHAHIHTDSIRAILLTEINTKLIAAILRWHANNGECLHKNIMLSAATINQEKLYDEEKKALSH